MLPHSITYTLQTHGVCFVLYRFSPRHHYIFRPPVGVYMVSTFDLDAQGGHVAHRQKAGFWIALCTP